MPKPVCVKCQRFFKPYHNGVYLMEGKPKENGAKPGTEEADKWIPYKLWHGDLLKCQGCETEIIVGFGLEPMWQDYKGPELTKPDYTVNDC